MEYTQNYQLPTWAEEDRIMRADFNAMTGKIDAALGTLAGQVSRVGNCQIYTTAYTGNGGSGPSTPRSVTFPGAPAVVLVAGEGYYGMTALRGATHATIYSGGNVALTWSGNTLRWFGNNARDQLNTSGQTYYVVALIAK